MIEQGLNSLLMPAGKRGKSWNQPFGEAQSATKVHG